MKNKQGEAMNHRIGQNFFFYNIKQQLNKNMRKNV